jgi:hypothetical protein
MSTKVETRLYSMADGDLKQKADGLKTTITRDLEDFATRNITDTQVTAYQTLIDVFDDTTTDEELLGEVGVATDAKNAVADNTRKAIRTIRGMADTAYGGKGKYHIFGFEDLARLTDADLYRLAKRVVRVGTKLLTDLAEQGLTAAQLTALDNLAKDFDKAIDAVEDTIENRDLETQDRIKKGNTLWQEMLRLAAIGKSLYEDTNEAKFNDYVLIGGDGGGGDAPTPPPVG